MKLFQLCTQQVQLNKPLPWGVRNEQGYLLLQKGYVIKDAEQLGSLLHKGVYVDIEDYEANHRAEKIAEGKSNTFAMWSDINLRVASLLGQAAQHDNFDTGVNNASKDIHIAIAIAIAIAKDVEAGMFAMMSSDPDNYAIAHSIQTAFVASLAADHFGLSSDERSSLSNAALTSNIAMLTIQNLLYKQAGPLTDEQRNTIDAHPKDGRAMLEQSNVQDMHWLNAVEKHRVTTDGRGLPEDRRDLNDLACIIHYSDVYLAKVGARAYRPAIAPNKAARDLYVSSGGLHNPYVSAIIKEVGLYPPGTFVKLANGDTALVIRRGEHAHMPMAYSLISKSGTLYPESVPRNTALDTYKVLTSVSKSSVSTKIDCQKLYEIALT